MIMGIALSRLGKGVSTIVLLVAVFLGSFSGCSSYVTMEDKGTMENEDSLRMKGMRYLLGRGVQQSDARAFAYFKQAAQQDDAFAQNELAYLYATGRGTGQDYQAAAQWYERAAHHDLPSARYNLGLLYAYGLGVPRNRAIAVQLFKKAASQGFEPAGQLLQHPLF